MAAVMTVMAVGCCYYNACCFSVDVVVTVEADAVTAAIL